MGIGDLVSRVFGARPAPLRDLESRVACFREILQANNTALGAIARIQEALAGEVAVTSAEARRLVTTVTVQTYRMLVNLERLAGRRHRALRPRFEAIKGEIVRRGEVTPALREVGLTVPLDEVRADLAEAVGQKSAFLGEARALLGEDVPTGFATTVAAYEAFLAHRGLGARLAALLDGADLDDVPTLFRVCSGARTLIEAAPLPPALGAALAAAAAALPGGDALRLAVRSSALQEGGRELSFAGQYRSFLNVTRAGVADAYRGVVASKYSPQAVTYRRIRGFDDGEIGVCCCVIPMVEAAAAGVLYSACRTGTATRTLVQAVRGLGLSAVDGSATPETHLIDRDARAVVERVSGRQTSLIRSLPTEGTEKVPLTDGDAPILTEAEALAVAARAWKLEQALGTPVDVEWALDPARQVRVLQVRPQPEHAGAVRPTGSLRPGVPVLLVGGSRAAGGAGAGPAHHLRGDLDLLRCPPGAVLVLRDADPRFAVLLPRAAAVVADFGETTGHLATVARELGVPALLATGAATATVPPGAEVTVDADAGVVYAGRVAGVAVGPPPGPPRYPAREQLAAVADWIVPLTVTDRLASGFAPRKCQTLHDVIRYSHQATIEAMFSLGDRAVRDGASVRRLVSEVPIDCRLLDLGGGLLPGAGDPEVTIADVASRPMRALWSGLTDPRLRWGGTRAVNVRGFVSSMVNFGFDEDARVRDLGEPSYAFIAADYLSFNSRIGYHFSTVDCRIAADQEQSYLSFRFVGGSTGVEQRSRRATLIERLLQSGGFETDCHLDLVNARLRRQPAEVMEAQVQRLGLLLEFVNHLDMALTTDAAAADYEAAFRRGDYGFRRGPHA